MPQIARGTRCRPQGLLLLTTVVLTAFFNSQSRAAELAALAAASRSITSTELQEHVEVLADDAMEGREGGTRGGRAASIYLRKEIAKSGFKPLGTDGDYFQYFHGRYRNILAMLEGADPQLRREVVIVGAHFDHVGYGQRSNSYGPLGYIHNGADDNASGTSGILELVDAFGKLPTPPRRSVVFALWDGEEKGLLGSRYYLSNPIIALNRTKAFVNLDMIGRLRNDRIRVFGTRTAAGFRGLVSRVNTHPELTLDFPWELKDNSDHYAFFERSVPILMLHTGLHNDYHRPRDDAHKINAAGMQRVVRFLFALICEMANADQMPGFRPASRYESPATRRNVERPLPPLPSRLGVSWDPAIKTDEGVRLISVRQGSAASQAGLRPGDTILRFAGSDVTNGEDLLSAVVGAVNPVTAIVQRPGEKELTELSIELSGKPHRVGISWRTDEGEPRVVIVNRVVPGSSADRAGIQVHDRLCRVAGQEFADSNEFHQAITSAAGPTELLVERAGKMLVLTVTPTVSPTESTSASVAADAPDAADP
jgi:hypothetical protein